MTRSDCTCMVIVFIVSLSTLKYFSTASSDDFTVQIWDWEGRGLGNNAPGLCYATAVSDLDTTLHSPLVSN